MQCKKLEPIAPMQPKNNRKYVITAQLQEKILILDVFKEGTYRGRHAIHTETGEYMQYSPDTGSWKQHKFGNLLDLDMKPYGYFSYSDAKNRTFFDTKEMEEMAREELSVTKINYHPDIFYQINNMEQKYAGKKRQRIEDNRVMKVQDKMRLVPAVPEKAREWIWQMEGAEDYAFRDEEQRWHCTACGESTHPRYLHREDGEKKLRHNDRVICPRCGKIVMAKTRTNQIKKKSRFYMAQRMDDRMSVWRSFDVEMEWTMDGRKIWLNEAIRVIIYHLSTGSKYAGEIFYNQYATGEVFTGGQWIKEYAYFDNKGNPSQRRMGKEYLYPEGIEEALDGTAYQGCSRIISQMAADGIKLDYNRLISTQGCGNMPGVIEYLCKGRFWRLLEETIDHIGFYNPVNYYGCLNIGGATIEEIFGINDRQMINRTREMDGGEICIKWMRLSDRTGTKINQETLQWLEKNRIDPKDIYFLKSRMTPQQIMNYIRRQQAEEYKGKTAGQVVDQWRDYMDMLDRLDRKTDDEMMYRPRQLKRRHDECVEEINAQRIREEMKRNAVEREREAEKMRKRFPGAEEILKEIRGKYEYRDEEYIITVPRELTDIIMEGQALHHCAGATDRYFDRIMQRETYICFLRRASDPETPYYTIEVEPGGTIRQHRGLYDEEPNIEQVKPFLRKWQKEIHKRMTGEDREHAAASAVKRQQNIEELKRNRNTRVLRGLMEDFMLGEDISGEEETIPEDALMAAGA